ncbi:hypothetical protein AJ80_03093 [Polytolypa hystricis UAMH7299]|uniref:Very-long-chain (3R)-3-hydroxyacyl-CoA dehydratase n=1 Tax=Polytolypa hystricis (strain UAMH7299) TaxID=1447883 RepID=A0A2B7YKE0_POLH7|nr:hypothetical protein AJ80_03093 [Polytolypa hystricis UAMH7299]
MATPSTPSKPQRRSSPYLLIYNTASFVLWATVTLRLATLLPLLAPRGHVAAIYDQLFSLLLFTQSLALLEVFHSLLGIVRASVVTTSMQVASRILLVWGVMYVFSEGRMGAGKGLFGGSGELSGPSKVAVGDGGRLGDWGFVGCVAAWGVTECIRYGFFAVQLFELEVPGWISWLRYNTFFVLYPIGISSECLLMYLSIGPAREIHPAFAWFFIAVLGIYVPGSYILYTHMMSQRRKVRAANAAKKAN